MNNLKKSDTWKIESTTAIQFMASKDIDEKRVINSNTDYREITSGKKHKIINELFESLLSRYQIDFKESTEGYDFVFAHTDILYFICHKISSNHEGSYIDFPD